MIQIGQTPVLLQDPSGKIDQYIERHHSLDLMRAFASPAMVRVPRGSNLLFPNYPSLPAPRLNQIVVPTGATRWSYGLFLVTTAQKDAILSEAGIAANKNKLKVQFGSGNNWHAATSPTATNFKPNLSLTMSPLPPRPMTPADLPQTTDVQNLWVLPMVDQRYWWQFLNVDLIESQTFTTIQGTLDYLNGRLNSTATVTLSCPNPKHDKVPDIATGNNYENVAVVLETLAWHIGCQMVPTLNAQTVRNTDLETGFTLLSVDDSEKIHEFNLVGKCGIADCTRTAGSSTLPSVVTSPNSGFEFVGLPMIEMGGAMTLNQGSAFLPEKIQIPAKTTYAVQTAVAVGLTTIKTIPGTSAVFRLKWKGVDPIPDSLRDQAAKDFFNRFKYVHDYTFAGIQKWQPTAYDDCVVFFQTRFADGLRCQTRVRSWMQNLIPETMVAAGKVTDTKPPSSSGRSCGDCLNCLDADVDNSNGDCALVGTDSPNSWFLYKDVSDCCDGEINIINSNVELIHVAGGCIWQSEEFKCRERFIEESWLNPANPEINEDIFFRWILTIGATWTELEQRFYRKV